jgi:hypothetical protein
MLDQLCHGFFVGSQGLNSGELIVAHEAAVTHNIGTEDSGQLALYIVCGHPITSPNTKASKGV